LFLIISAYSAAGITPTRSPTEVSRFVDGIPPTQRRTQLRWWDSPTQSPMLARSIVGSALARRQQHKCRPTGSPHPTGECTPGSFSLPSAEHKCQPTGSSLLNIRKGEPLVVSLCQVHTESSLCCGPYPRSE